MRTAAAGMLSAAQERAAAAGFSSTLRRSFCGAMSRRLTLSLVKAHFSVTSSRRLPKSRESTDQHPGPSIVMPMLTAMSRIAVCGRSLPIIAHHVSANAATMPASGVHNPTRSSPPAAIPRRPGTKASGCRLTSRSGTPFTSSRPPAEKRNSSNPLPGQPLGKMEKRRCRVFTLTPPNLR